MGYIYKIYNDINNKVYIGQTSNTLEERFKQHKKHYQRETSPNYPLYNAMKKYGIEHFFIESIEETDNLQEREKYWIQYYDSFNNGYNGTWGGDGLVKYNYDEIVHKYLTENTSIRQLAEQLGINRATVSRALKAKGIKVLSNAETSKKLKSKPIAQYDKNTLKFIATYPSIQAAADAVCGKRTVISQVVNGHKKSAYGYIWKLIEGNIE